jgi:hypothetical protein
MSASLKAASDINAELSKRLAMETTGSIQAKAKAKWRFYQVQRHLSKEREQQTPSTPATEKKRQREGAQKAESRRQYSLVSGGRGRKVKAFSDKDVTNAAHSLRADVYHLFEEIKELAGGPENVDALMMFMLMKYSEEYSFRAKKGSGQEGMGSCGVSKARSSCLPLL